MSESGLQQRKWLKGENLYLKASLWESPSVSQAQWCLPLITSTESGRLPVFIASSTQQASDPWGFIVRSYMTIKGRKESQSSNVCLDWCNVSPTPRESQTSHLVIDNFLNEVVDGHVVMTRSWSNFWVWNKCKAVYIFCPCCNPRARCLPYKASLENVVSHTSHWTRILSYSEFG